MINYKNGANEHRFRKSVEYITNPQKVKSVKIMTNYMDCVNPCKSLGIIEKRWDNENMKGRLFKHGIISFGVKDIKCVTAKDVLVETLKYYDDYPWIAALHSDVPNRLHAHFLLMMRNVKNGHKFSQSHSDLRDFRKHYHITARKRDLPGLKEFCINNDHELLSKKNCCERISECYLEQTCQEYDDVDYDFMSNTYDECQDVTNNDYWPIDNDGAEKSSDVQEYEIFPWGNSMSKEMLVDLEYFFKVGFMKGVQNNGK